jgi:gluconate 5-dehydrogenase
MANPFSLDNRVILVTGSSQGIGLGMAKALAAAGATVAINGRNADKVAAAVKVVGKKAVPCIFDATDDAAIDKAVTALENTTGPVDVLFNNAGINIRGPLIDYSEADWQTLMKLNVDAVFLVGKRVAKTMIARRRGKIINTLSLSAELARAGSGAYSVSKGALKMLTKVMAVEWGPHNIQVNAISPGWNLTDMMKDVLKKNPDLESWVNNRTPLGRWSNPDADLGGTAVYLASSASDFVTGQVIAVDGGFAATF